MNLAYFPGCSLHATAREYDTSTREVCQRLGVHLEEVEDWNCCGASSAHSLDRELNEGLNLRNLSQVGKMGLLHVMTPCSGCFNRLKSTSIGLEAVGSTARTHGRTSGQPMVGRGEVPKVSHLLQFLVDEVGLTRIAEPLQIPLKGLKLAAYYGCLITRPRRVAQFDDSEQPVSMDRVLQALGAETVSWSHKAECCGGPFALSETEIVVDLSRQILDAARYAGAEALVVACPMCQLNLDTRQGGIAGGRGRYADLPVIYLTQLVALAYGCPPRRTGMRRLLVSPMPLLRTKGLV